MKILSMLAIGRLSIQLTESVKSPRKNFRTSVVNHISGAHQLTAKSRIDVTIMK